MHPRLSWGTVPFWLKPGPRGASQTVGLKSGLRVGGMSTVHLPPAGEIKAAVDGAPTSGPKAREGRRTLKQLSQRCPQVDASDENNLRLVVAMKSLGVTNVNLSTFKDWAKKVTGFVTDEQMVYLQPKADLTPTPAQRKWLVPEWKVKGAVDTETYWVFETPGDLLGSLPIRRRIGVTGTRDMGEQAGLLALGGGAATASGSRSSGAAAPTVEPAEQEETRKGEGNGEPAPAKPGYDPGAKRPCPGGGAGGAADKRQRPLPQQPSDPDHEKLWKGTAALFKGCKEDCKAGRYMSPDAMDGNNALFKVRMFTSWLADRQGGAAGAAAYLPREKEFFKFVVQWLLEGDTWARMPAFVKVFEEAEKLDGSLLPKIVKAISALCKVPLTAGWKHGSTEGQEVDLASFKLSPGETAILTDCAFFRSFKQARFEALFALAK
ncbi:unnamed protein product, partial [Prorocentrum cordatum]